MKFVHQVSKLVSYTHSRAHGILYVVEKV